ncbi:ethanolaminephosphotransferase 1-like [Octopus vulgaris]|uniref:Ethanolaminephosphotransferase 1-like n=2 Tax=Octopus TaxID=6643 RepID=A0AA36AW12_OCTVU|nr:cholinephosphotransferase 1 [Octopus sinensis]CAI9723355.1 ethanolaminephosphotransferase 1-like [Octopus vulgaris]
MVTKGKEVLTNIQLRRLLEHQYKAEGSSLLEPVMQKFWRWLVEQVPRWWAPNAITATGLVLNIMTTLVMVYYSPDAKHKVPSWVYIINALGVFIYQSLDAIDGKQARRTSTSTPLGELLDHGCDSLSTVFVTIGICIALELGHHLNWFFFNCFAIMFLFYSAHWQSYVSGTLRFGMIDVTEGQLIVMAVYLFNAFVGTDFWRLQVPGLGTSFQLIPVYFGIFAAVLQCIQNFSVIIIKGGVGKNRSTVAGTSTIFPILPISIIMCLAFVIYHKSPTHIYMNHPCLYVISFGMASAKITNKLVIAHMTRSEMDLLDYTLLGPLFVCLNQYFDCKLNEVFVLWIFCIYCTCNLLYFARQVCLQISRYLNIYIFTITRKPNQVKENTRNNRTRQNH